MFTSGVRMGAGGPRPVARGGLGQRREMGRLGVGHLGRVQQELAVGAELHVGGRAGVVRRVREAQGSGQDNLWRGRRLGWNYKRLEGEIIREV